MRKPVDLRERVVAAVKSGGMSLSRGGGAVCTENLNPNVVVMKSAQDGVRTYDAGSLDRTRDRRILAQ
jgi:hypothetical protein